MGSGGRRSPCGGRSAASWSSEVEKKPPRSGSPKRAIIVSASPLATLEPAHLEGRLVEGEQRLQQEGVVLEVGVELRLAVVVGAQQAAVRRRAVSVSTKSAQSRAASR